MYTSGFQGLVLGNCERRLATLARRLGRDRPVLYHGTRYWAQILAERTLRANSIGPLVSLTRSAEVAAFSAFLPRDRTSGCPAILVLDRFTLQARYRLECSHAAWVGDGDVERDEAEEIIRGRDVDDLDRYLLNVVTISEAHTSGTNAR